MKRREFITLLGGTAVAWPLPAWAQQRSMPTIGWISDSTFLRLDPFRQGLMEVGYIEGQNVAIDYRSANLQLDRLPALAADLVRRQVTMIVASNTASALAAKAATTTIPIVFYTGADPVQLGLVASLNRPGGNLTGLTSMIVELGAKQLELIHEVVPAKTNFALLVNPTNPALADPTIRTLQAAARTLGLQLELLYAANERDIDAAFARLIQLHPSALVVGPDPLWSTRRDQLVELTIRHAVPTMFELPDFAAAGGLMSYGASLSSVFRQLGVYSGRILKGEKPQDLPVQQPTKFDFIINLKTARTLGLTIPLPLLAFADEVIE